MSVAVAVAVAVAVGVTNGVADGLGAPRYDISMSATPAVVPVLATAIPLVIVMPTGKLITLKFPTPSVVCHSQSTFGVDSLVLTVSTHDVPALLILQRTVFRYAVESVGL